MKYKSINLSAFSVYQDRVLRNNKFVIYVAFDIVKENILICDRFIKWFKIQKQECTYL